MPNCRKCGATFKSGGKLCKGCKTADSATGEATDLRANRGKADTTVGSDGRGTVRLQIQLNKDSSTLASEVIESTGGVTETAIDTAFDRMLLSWGASKKLQAMARECYELHKSKWGTYTGGNSYSVYFDENSKTTKGRPKGGYRLDVENVRQAEGKPNFI